MKTKHVEDEADRPDALVPDPVVAKEIGTTLMGINRRDHDPKMAELNWPVKITIRNRNFRSRKQLEQHKATVLQQAMSKRTAKAG
jgi:hypothetical protein